MIRTSDARFMSGFTLTQYNNARTRGTLPGVTPSESEDVTAEANRWTQHPLKDSVVALRIQRDLEDHLPGKPGKYDKKPSPFSGLAPRTASVVAANIIGAVNGAGYTMARLVHPDADDCWGAWVAEPHYDEEGGHYHCGWFAAGTLVEVASTIGSSKEDASRVVLVNVSRAAREVLGKGMALRIPECLELYERYADLEA